MAWVEVYGGQRSLAFLSFKFFFNSDSSNESSKVLEFARSRSVANKMQNNKCCR